LTAKFSFGNGLKFPELFVDFMEGTIPGTVNFSVDTTLEERKTLLADVPRQAPIILFCKSNRCSYADDIARFLRHNGFENMVIYRDGFSRWK